MPKITKGEMKRLFVARLLEENPFLYDGSYYAHRVSSEGNPAGLVWCDA